MVLGAYKMPYARSVGGLARAFLEHMDFQQVLSASLLSLAFLALVSLKLALVCLGLTLACVGLLRFLAGRWLGGITGDALGALNEITEVVLLAVSACCFCG